MTQALARAAALGRLRSADLELSPGRYVVLSNEAEPLSDLVTLLAGREPPRRGQVWLDGAAPAASPATRRKIAALFADEALLPAPSVLASVALALLARGQPESGAEKALSDVGLAGLAKLAPHSLSPRQTRSVALALALCHDTASLLVLHEPLATDVQRSRVLEALDEHTERGAIVLTATTSAADAVQLGGSWLAVELGRVQTAHGPEPRLGTGPWQQVLVEASDASRLATLLRDSPLGLGVELGSEPRLLKVSGPALDVTVREVASLARQAGIEIARLTATVPPIDALLAARAGFARGAYEAARAAAHGSTPSAHPGSFGGYS